MRRLSGMKFKWQERLLTMFRALDVSVGRRLGPIMALDLPIVADVSDTDSSDYG